MAERISNLTTNERQQLLKLARASIYAAASGSPLPYPDQATLTDRLIIPAACFVTLHQRRELRGCTGTLLARQPLADEVIHTAAQTALYDPRFSPLAPDEVSLTEIEISVLTAPAKLEVPSPEVLPSLIRPGTDGVTLYRGPYRATFLPQVWDKIPDPVTFLDMLCQKMGLQARAWTHPGMQVEVYQVEEFSENEHN